MLLELHLELGGLLDRAKSLFKPSAGSKVTLVIRNTKLSNGDIVIGDDDLNEAISCIHRFQERNSGELT